jgi:hypothetical protein
MAPDTRIFGYNIDDFGDSGVTDIAVAKTDPKLTSIFMLYLWCRTISKHKFFLLIFPLKSSEHLD